MLFSRSLSRLSHRSCLSRSFSFEPTSFIKINSRRFRDGENENFSLPEISSPSPRRRVITRSTILFVHFSSSTPPPPDRFGITGFYYFAHRESRKSRMFLIAVNPFEAKIRFTSGLFSRLPFSHRCSLSPFLIRPSSRVLFTRASLSATESQHFYRIACGLTEGSILFFRSSKDRDTHV